MSVVIGLAFTASASAFSSDPTPANTPEPKPGEGVLCLWALTSVASEVGKHCSRKNDPAFQSVLESSVALMDQYVLANGHIGVEAVVKFKSQQGGVGQSAAKLCTGDGIQLYDNLHAQGSAVVKEGVQKAVARPGMPTWGDCP